MLYVYTDQRNMGMSMKVEKSTLEQVKKRFQTVKEKQSEDKKQYGNFDLYVNVLYV